MGSEWSSAYGITATVPLVLQGPAGASMSTRAYNLAELTLEGVRQDAVANVIASFYGVLMAEMMRDVSSEALDIAREGYSLAMQRYDAGTISRFELLQSQVAYENRRPDSIAAEAGLDNARAAFAVSLGFPEDHPVTIEGDLCDPFPITLPETLEEAREMMRSTSTELATAEEIRRMGDAGVSLAASNFAPQLVFQTSYSYQAAVDDIMKITDEDYSRNWTTSASIQIPIFNGLGDYSGYRSARYDRLASYAQADDIENYASLGLVASWNALAQARETVDGAESTMGQAAEAAEIARVSYEAGIITRLEMDGAFLALTQARTNYASSLFSLKTAEANLARALGILEFETDVQEDSI
jgi:outer membrane protein